MQETPFANLSIGIDIAEVKRFAKMRPADPLAQRLFTHKELREIFGGGDSAQKLAARFAAKEAIMKAIGQTIDFGLIEVVSHGGKPPVVRFLEETWASKYTVQISLTHEKQLAVAVCLVYKSSKEEV